MEVNGSVPPVVDVLREHPSRRIETEEGPITQGLPVRLVLQREGASGELDLGDEGRFFPTDAALERWQQGSHGKSVVVYD